MGVPALPVSESIGRSRTLKAWVATHLDTLRHHALRSYQPAWMLILLVLIPIKDARLESAESIYDHVHQLYLRGDLTRTQIEAKEGYRRFSNSNPEQAKKFQLLLARALISRGMNSDALRILADSPSTLNDRNAFIETLTLEAVANIYLPRFDTAERKLSEAASICQSAVYVACNEIPLVRGVLALEQEKLPEAQQYFMGALSRVRNHRDRRSESLVLGNLCVIALQTEHYDEALDWGYAAYRIAAEFGWEDRKESLQGNLGWAYLELGDKERALQLFLAAAQTAERLGSVRFQIKWLTDAGYIYRDEGDFTRATAAHRKSFELAKEINSQQDIVNALEDLAHTDILAGKLDEAGTDLDLLALLVGKDGNRLDQLDVLLAQGEIAAARRQDQSAESAFRTVEQDPASQTSMRLGAEHQLARLYEAQNNIEAAEDTYQTALTTFESARAELKNEDSKLPFLANATPIYDDYIHLLVKQGRVEEALAAADQSRAQTLAQGLGLDADKPSPKPAALKASTVAAKRRATILFYWLGNQQSYLWAITAKETKLFSLPGQREIAPIIDRYRKALLEPEIAGDAATADGEALYRMLVSPAADRIPSDENVLVVCDGPLSLLNFETLVVPPKSTGAAPHYWIEDANVVSAPSLYMLAAAKAPARTTQKLLLLGDALSANPDYPELPNAKAEIRKVESHFAPADESVFARQSASASAYLKSPLRNYAYIHFVAHGVASRTDPLDSAIILSPTGTAEDSFKLHARDIIQHPIDARLVTVSACYGGGTRSYAGEGLVGLSWAFLRAGAHNVIGALWEASDDSTPQLMDDLYAGLASGMSPSAALRQAKLAMLHSQSKFRRPFYWAPFQIYAGL